MTDKQRAQAAISELKGTTFGYRLRPHSPRWNRAMAHLNAIVGLPPPPPPPPLGKLAPQTYNLGGGNQDPRFCVVDLPTNSAGERFEPSNPGIRYDGEGLNLIGRNRNKIVAGLKPADQMDGRGSCDPYDTFPPWPAASYEP